MSKIEFLVTKERVELVEIGDLLDLEETPNSTRAQMKLLANFVTNGDGQHLEPAEALKALRKLNVGQLSQTVQGIMGQIQDVAAPKA